MNVARHLPNMITVLRFVLIVPVVLSLLGENFRWGLAFFAIAGLSDGLDGFLARHFGWTSRFGAIADPLADKILMGVVFIALTVTGHVPVWLTAAVLLRDVVIVTGAAFYHWLFGELKFAARATGKTNTVVQIVFVLLVLVGLAQIPGLEALNDMREVGEIVVLTFAILSGGDYVITWSRLAIQHESANDAGPDS